DYVYIADAVRANVAALDRGDGEAINIASGIGTSVNEIFESLKAATSYQREA
ncbi:MAG TPA: UDP-glucose 4-epimerase, partial [Chloroflexi bacterium]|nr:UDP-glucose 4-epimerase [Chloroflexota bacterium]